MPHRTHTWSKTCLSHLPRAHLEYTHRNAWTRLRSVNSCNSTNAWRTWILNSSLSGKTRHWGGGEQKSGADKENPGQPSPQPGSFPSCALWSHTVREKPLSVGWLNKWGVSPLCIRQLLFPRTAVATAASVRNSSKSMEHSATPDMPPCCRHLPEALPLPQVVTNGRLVEPFTFI